MRTGDPRLPERFWAKVHVDADGCWLWTGGKNSHGYGIIQVSRQVGAYGAHRYAYEALVGPISYELDHLCRVRLCVNPDHLEDVTHQVNSARGFSFNKAKTHCPKGHEYEGWNLVIKKDGCRRCRACHAESERNRKKNVNK